MNKMLSDRKLMAFGLAGLYCMNREATDFFFFSVCNGHLLFMPWIYQYMFALLNHRYENFLDVVLVVSALSWVLLKYTKSRKNSLIFFIFAILWYELALLLLHPIEKLSIVIRPSPSLEYGVLVDLRALHPLAKVYAQSSFPSGHGMLFGYFGAIANALFPSHLKRRYVRLSMICCLPRLISGAHALSDILAGYALGIVVWKGFEASWVCILHLRKHLNQPKKPIFSKEELDSRFTY